MNGIILWDEWVALIRPFYFNGKRPRPPMRIEKMLRMYLLQIWFNLSDEEVEDAICDSYVMCIIMRINFINEKVPDATTLLHLRKLLKENCLGKAMFKESTMHWKRQVN